MTRTIAKFVAPAALVLASFAAQAGEGPIDVRTAPSAQPQSSQTTVAQQPAQKPVINVGA